MADIAGDGFRSRWTGVQGSRIHDRYRCPDPVRMSRRAGLPGGMPIVLLHGLAVSHRYLMPTAVALAGGHPVLVPDLPGFGLSDKPRSAYDVGEHADQLAAWLDALELGEVCVVGHSFGAEVAARLAVLRPDVVAALVLAGPTTDPAARSRRALIGRWAADLLVEAPWQSPVMVRDVIDAKPWRIWATVGHSVGNAIERDLRRLRVRPLVLGGRLDPVSPLRWRAAVAARTGGRCVTIPNAAHNVLTTSGRRCAAAIEDHLG